jgi:hypothetical protein
VNETSSTRLLEHAVDHGMYPYKFYEEYCPFVAPLRDQAEFDRIVAKARKRVEAFGSFTLNSTKPPSQG